MRWRAASTVYARQIRKVADFVKRSLGDVLMATKQLPDESSTNDLLFRSLSVLLRFASTVHFPEVCKPAFITQLLKTATEHERFSTINA
jgi:hypothetical protein